MINIIEKFNDDIPFFKESIVKDILSWEDLEGLLNLRPFLNVKRFNFANNNLKYSWQKELNSNFISTINSIQNETWLTDIDTWPANQLKNIVYDNVCYLSDCSRVNKKINNICEQIENKWNYPTDAHIYFSLKETKEKQNVGFKKHWDYSHNLIIQVDGETNFKVWNKKIKDGDRQIEISELPMLDVVMKSGDVVYIPKYMVHQAISLTKRLSISFSMNTDSSRNAQDRTWITIND